MPTLKQLEEKNLFLAIVTDAPKTKAYQRLGMKIDHFFRFVVGYETLIASKSLDYLFVSSDLLKRS